MKTAITTVDNPYDPIDQFDSWFLYDVTMNHNTCALLGRIARTSDQLSDAENDAEIERAIDDIINMMLKRSIKKFRINFGHLQFDTKCLSLCVS